MNQIAVLFPGQGSQSVGMQKTLLENFPYTKIIFEEASEALKDNLIKLCAEGPADSLQLTQNAQPAILTVSYAWFTVLKRTFGINPVAGAGHSLGEYSALTSAKSLSLSQAVCLVRKRGELMQKAVPTGKGKMAAILGLEDEKVKKLCELATKNDKDLVVPANFNAPMQVVVAGHKTAVERLELLAKGELHPELKAKKVIPLQVSAPFHCPLMQDMSEEFEPYLHSISWKSPEFSIAHNFDALLKNTSDLTPILKAQIANPVLWTSCVQTLNQNGVTTYIELGPGKVLTGLVKRIIEEVKIFAFENLDDIKKFEIQLKGKA